MALSWPGAASTMRTAFPPARLGLGLPLQSDPLSFLMLWANKARNAVFTQAPLQLLLLAGGFMLFGLDYASASSNAW